MASNTTKNVQLSLDVPVVVKLLDSWEEVISLLIEQLVALIVPNQSMLLDDASNTLFLDWHSDRGLGFSSDIPAFMNCYGFKDGN